MLGRRETMSLLERYGIEPSRSLGQNFVVDPQLVERIVDVSQLNGRTNVVEIGPGLGSMTRLLALRSGKVVAVEKDTSLLPLLRERVQDLADRVEVVRADALTVDWTALLGSGLEWTLVANLPYNVAVPLIMSVMHTAPMIRTAMVMVQKEVADRLAASPGGRTIGAPTIHLAWFARARTVIDVPPESFHPRPRVYSAVVEIIRTPTPSNSVGVDDVMRLVNAAFHQRRKMLRSSLGALVGGPAFHEAGVDPTARPETLSLDQWIALTEVAGGPTGRR